MNGAKILLKSLEEQNVKTVFGIPGGVLLKLYDEFKGSSIEHILARHEQGAAHAADAYARYTGEVGVCIATSGPGASNLVTGIATAFMDSVPMVAITGQVKSALLGKDAFQELNTVGVTQPITKHNYLVKNAADIPWIVKEAFFIANSGRPGPVLIDIPADIYTQEVDEAILAEAHVHDYIERKFKHEDLNQEKLTTIIEELNKAKKPLLLLGNGVNLADGAFALVEKLVNEFDLLVTTTLYGKGVINEDHPNCLKMLGMHGTFEANYATQNCDFILNIGSRFDDRITCNVDHFLESCNYVAHVNIDGSEDSKNVETNTFLEADAFEFLSALYDRKDEINKTDYNEWKKEVNATKKDVNNKPAHNLHPVNVSKFINESICDNTTIVTDVGQHQMFAALYMYPKANRKFISSGGLGTMGYGCPAAMGVAFANKDENVILITGDGSFQMMNQELAVYKQYNLNIKVVIFDNKCLGMVRQWQELFFNKNYAESLFDVSPDWGIMSKAYGLDYVKVAEPSDLSKLKDALNKKGPAIIEVTLDERANVFPMVPSFASLTDIRGE